MTDLILHHYFASPFAEKIRALLGYKQLAWRSVDIPVVMPKPDLTALTGGYRKTPVLQLGSDIYCDTWLIARTVEARFPERPVFDVASAAVGAAAARWFDRDLFMAVISQLFQRSVAPASMETLGGPQQAVSFAEDRARMMGTAPVRPPRAEDGKVVLDQTLRQLETQLAQSGPFLAGASLTWLDLCAYHPLWAVVQNRLLVRQLDAHPHMLAWLERIRVFGHGEATPLSSADALTVARTSEPMAHAETAAGLDRLSIGDDVEISAADYGLEPTVGRLEYVAADEIAIAREDERAGRVVVHFPRVGYRVKARS